MAGLADFGYLYGAANLGSSAAFANQLPVDKNAVIGAFPKNYNDNITELTTLETNKAALDTGRATRAENALRLSQQPVSPNIDTPVVTVAPTPDDQMVSPIYAATASTEINPPEPNVPSLGYMYPGIAIGQAPFGPQSLAAGLRNQFVTDQQAAEAARLRQQAEIQAGLVAAGLTVPPSGTSEAAEAYRGIVFGKQVTTANKSGAFTKFVPAPPEPTVLVNGEPISQSAAERLAAASQTMAKILSITDPTQMPPGAKAIIDAARKAGVDPKIALAVGVMESNLNTETGDSPKGAKGVMQVIPGTYEATRQKFLKSSDPALRALAASLPVATYGTKGADDKITYSWDTKVALSAEQQAIAGVLYIKDLQQSYPNRAANIIFAMYHAGPGHDAFDRGEVPGSLSDFGTDPKTNKPYGMYTKDYNTVGIGLFNQLAQGGFKDTGAGLKTDTAAAGTADTAGTSTTAAGVKPPTGATAGTTTSATAPGAVNPNLKPVSTIINIPQAQVEANEKQLIASRQAVVDQYKQINELNKRYVQEAEVRLRKEASIKEAQLLQDMEFAKTGGNGVLYTQLNNQITALYTKLNSDLDGIAKDYEKGQLSANKGIAAELKVQDIGLWSFAIEKSIRDFNINGGVGQFNHILQNYAGSDTVIQQLATGSYSLLIRKPGTNEFVPQVGEDGSIKQYTKDEMSSQFHQIVDKVHRANVTAATAERDQLVAMENFKANLEIQKEVAKIQATLFKDLKVEEYKAKIESLKNSNDFEIKPDTANGTTIIIPKGQRKFMLVYNPNPPDVPTRDGPMPGPVITAVPFPTVGLNAN